MRSTAPATPETRSIVIEGELVRIMRTVVERQVRTGDLMLEISKMQPLKTGLLPRGCVAFLRRHDAHEQPCVLYVIERPAGLVTVRYKSGGSHDEQKDDNLSELALSWPYTQWLVHWAGPAISELHLTCTKTPIRSLDDPIFVLPMPNLYEDGQGGVCLGNLVMPDTLGPAERTERLIEAVLSSLWNDDLMPDYKALGLKNLAEWAERSLTDPECGLKLEYRPHRAETLGQLIDTLAGETP